MQSLLMESFTRTQKPISKRQKQQEEDDEQEEESKREEQDQDESDQHQVRIERKKSESSEELEAMKDAFESDESYLITTEDLRDERFSNDPNGGNGLKNSGQGDENGRNHGFKIKKIVKRRKDFQWKYFWVKQQNAVKGSKPICLRKWVKVKVIHENGDVEQAIPSEQNLNGNKQIAQN